jgi:hypothetical protein
VIAVYSHWDGGHLRIFCMKSSLCLLYAISPLRIQKVSDSKWYGYARSRAILAVLALQYGLEGAQSA